MLPRWVYTVIAVWLILAISTFAFTWSKCGTKTFIIAYGGLAAAATGICD